MREPSRDFTTVDVVISHNPDRGTSRNTLALIRNSAIEPHVIEHLKTPPARALLVRLIERADLTPHIPKEDGEVVIEADARRT